MFDHIDANKDGSVTMDEVKAAIFKYVDKDGSGDWSLKEVLGAIEGVAKEHKV